MHIVDTTMFWSPRGGGVGQYLRAKHAFLTGAAHCRHTLVTPGTLRPQAPRVPGVPLPLSGGYRWPVSRADAREVLIDLAPDLIEAGDPYPLAWAALDAAAAAGVPAVACYHSDLPALAGRVGGRLGGRVGEHLARRLARTYARRLYQRFDLVLAPSRAALASLDDLGVRRAVHQPLGVDTRLFQPARRSLRWRRLQGFGPRDKLLLYVGRYSPEKNLEVLVDAVARIGPGHWLLTLGAGPCRLAGAQVRDLGYATDRAQLANIVASVDALVHAGDQETFGLAALEALASGIPVIASAHGGLGELVDERVGAQVPATNGAAFAEAIEATLRRPRAALARAARRHALAYDWQRVLPSLLRHYRRLA